MPKKRSAEEATPARARRGEAQAEERSGRGNIEVRQSRGGKPVPRAVKPEVPESHDAGEVAETASLSGVSRPPRRATAVIPEGFTVAPSVAAAPLGQPLSVRLCPAYLAPEEGGGYSASVATLPGCHSQGDTLEEAAANITEALEGVLETYREQGLPVPWRQATRKPTRAVLHRILVRG